MQLDESVIQFDRISIESLQRSVLKMATLIVKKILKNFFLLQLNFAASLAVKFCQEIATLIFFL